METVQPRGLLVLGGVRQWASLLYDYNGHGSGGENASGSSSNQFKETYHFGTDVAIIDPHLLSIQLDSDAWFDQSRFAREGGGSRSTNDVQFRYTLTAVAFDRDPYPVVVTSSRDQTTVTGTFTPTYTTTTSNNGITASFHHHVVPVRLSYQRGTLDTSGLSQDSSTMTDNFTLNASNSFGEIGYTEMNGAFSRQQVASGRAESNSRVYQLSLNNSLNLDKEKRYTLNTFLQAQESQLEQDGTSIPQRTTDLTEALACRFGGALLGGAKYQYSSNKTVGFNDKEQVLKSNQFSAFISHRLYRNLETRLSGQYRQGEINGGNESMYGGAAAVSYRRSLPAESELSLGVSGGHQVTSRDLPGSTLTIREEQHTAGQQGESFPLKAAGTGIIRIVSVVSHNPEITYTEGTDYLADFPANGSIFIIPGGTINPGTVLFITYTLDLNPSVKYSTDTVSVSNTLTLFRNRYRFFGSLSEQKQDLVSGQATDSSLPTTRTALLRMDANYPSNVLSLEYAGYSSGATSYDYVEGGWRFERRYPLSGFTSRVRNRYTAYGPVGVGGSGYAENTFEFGGSYSRTFFSWIKAMVQLNLVDIRGGAITRDYVYFRSELHGQINSLLLNLAGQTMWRLAGSNSTRDDSVHVGVTRYF